MEVSWNFDNGVTPNYNIAPCVFGRRKINDGVKKGQCLKAFWIDGIKLDEWETNKRNDKDDQMKVCYRLPHGFVFITKWSSHLIIFFFFSYSRLVLYIPSISL